MLTTVLALALAQSADACGPYGIQTLHFADGAREAVVTYGEIALTDTAGESTAIQTDLWRVVDLVFVDDGVLVTGYGAAYNVMLYAPDGTLLRAWQTDSHITDLSVTRRGVLASGTDDLGESVPTRLLVWGS
jgi:hypothetical protein